MFRIFIILWTIHIFLYSFTFGAQTWNRNQSHVLPYTYHNWYVEPELIGARTDPYEWKEIEQPYWDSSKHGPGVQRLRKRKFDKNVRKMYVHSPYHNFHPKYFDLNGVLYKQDAVTTSLEEPQECNGFDNILNDIGIMSLAFGIVGATTGVTTNVLSVIGFVFSIVSVLTASGPSTLILILERLFGWELEFFGSIVEVSGVLDNIVTTYFSIPFSLFTNIASIFGSIVSVISILLGVFALFPEELEEFFISDFGQEFVKNYGCHNPYLMRNISTSFR